MVINISEAKTTLSKLIALVESGEEFTIGRAGKPIAKLSPIQKKVFPRNFQNEWENKVTISDDFEELPSEFLAHFS